MTTATAEPVARPVPPPADPELATFADLMLRLGPGRNLLLTGVDWAGYEYLLAARTAAGRRGPRLFYCEGVLEAMTTGSVHERLKKALALLIEAWLEEAGGRYIPGGGMTVRREDRERGFEPDECYYLQNWSRVVAWRELDFSTDPPPDLVVEVEVSRSAGPRMPVYAGLGVPEVWRFNGQRLTVHQLQPGATYRESPTSRAIPTFPFADAPRFLAMASAGTDHATLSREFRAWVRSLPPAAPPA